MAALNTKSRANYEEWLESIDDNDLKSFVFANTALEVEFGSDDFKLVYSGVSEGEPVDCHMIEARVNGKTKDKQLKKFVKTTGSLAKIRTCLAFALFPRATADYCLGNYVREALQASPVKGEAVVNKVHVQLSPSVTWEGDQPLAEVGTPPFVFEKIPFPGHKVDGTTRGCDK
ncbi:hypothetical protein HO173_009961 [Letharia columbiana]|uniref:Uncharacterized protein n=1 Tax=Letharia columbiana TaxID=112416 RepID=A0A8H6FNN8_9LECA|nr:uncharacterized protein HO173_009961 [Letharia columbiana]KAF6231878.1 hypothetical protein HO173_009961 [Letharia columbiana]